MKVYKMVMRSATVYGLETGGRDGKSEVSNEKNLLGSAAQQLLIFNPGCTGLEISILEERLRQRWFEHVQSRRRLNMEIFGYSEGGHAEG